MKSRFRSDSKLIVASARRLAPCPAGGLVPLDHGVSQFPVDACANRVGRVLASRVGQCKSADFQACAMTSYNQYTLAFIQGSHQVFYTQRIDEFWHSSFRAAPAPGHFHDHSHCRAKTGPQDSCSFLFGPFRKTALEIPFGNRPSPMSEAIRQRTKWCYQ